MTEFFPFGTRRTRRGFRLLPPAKFGIAHLLKGTAMNYNCAKCGGPIGRQPGPGGRRKFCQVCSPKRDRPDRQRGRGKTVPNVMTFDSGETQSLASNVTQATTAELLELGVPADHWRHVLAVTLATRIDHGDNETANGLVAMIRELNSLMTEIRASAPSVEESPLQMLRRRRAEQGR